jgi:hypothetical protein
LELSSFLVSTESSVVPDSCGFSCAVVSPSVISAIASGSSVMALLGGRATFLTGFRFLTLPQKPPLQNTRQARCFEAINEGRRRLSMEKKQQVWTKQ